MVREAKRLFTLTDLLAQAGQLRVEESLSNARAVLDAKESVMQLQEQVQAQAQICKDQAEQARSQVEQNKTEALRTKNEAGSAAQRASQYANTAREAISRVQKMVREAKQLSTPADGSVTAGKLAPDLALTGTPTAPTPHAKDKSTKIATTAFTQAAIATAFNGPDWQQLDEIGYQKLPGGLLIQWGAAPVYNAQETCLAFPMKFSKHCLSVNAQSINAGEKPQIESIEQIYSVTNLKVKLNVPDKNKDDKLEYQIQWFAIGY